MTAPIFEHIYKAREAFRIKYGFYPEKFHVSKNLLKILMRMMEQEPLLNRPPRGAAIELLGMELVKMTKNSPFIEFYLSATRGGKVMSIQTIITPSQMGIESPTISLND